MTWDFFNSVAGGASILGAILAVTGWLMSRGTNRLIREGTASTQAILERMDARTHETLTRMHDTTLATLDRMDQRAEERHRYER